MEELIKPSDDELNFIENNLNKDKDLLTDDQLKYLIERAKENDKEAKEIILKKNRGLIFKIALKFQNRDVPLDDLVQEASIGILKAINYFDINQGYKFSTYATWWIVNRIQRAIINQSKIIRLPYNRKILRLKNIEENYIKKYGLSPLDKEICDIYNKIYNENLNIDYVKDLRLYFNGIVSLNKIIVKESSHETTELQDFISDDSRTTEEIALDNIQFEGIRKIISGSIKTKLTNNEKFVLKYRFGFNNNEILTLQEIGDLLGLTKERVRQIELTALKKLAKLPGLLGVNVEKEKKLVK